MSDKAESTGTHFSREDVRAFQSGMDAALERAQHIPEGYIAGYPESVGGTIKADPEEAK